MYCKLLKEYHGDAAGVMKIDPLYCQEWAFIPHFYRPFYVYQYATSITAALHFAEEVLAAKPGARDKYLKLLASGGSMPPYEALKKAGLDMASPAPYRAVIQRMDRLMDEMEALLAAKCGASNAANWPLPVPASQARSRRSTCETRNATSDEG